MGERNHSICADCWYRQGRATAPIRDVRAEIERCCFCWRLTLEGIYIRDPKGCYLMCEGKHVHGSKDGKEVQG